MSFFSDEFRVRAIGVAVIFAAIGMFFSAGFAIGPISLLMIAALFLFAFAYPLFSFQMGIGLYPFLGILLSISTGSLIFGERAFGGSIDVSLVDAIMVFVAASWGARLLFSWHKRRDQFWEPRLPLWQPAVALIGAHLASAFSSLQPDPYLVVKYALRPVTFQYVASVLLPVNFLRTPKRLRSALAIVGIVGTFAALNGLVAMFLPQQAGAWIGRAYPLPVFGVNALGENHNELAAILVFTAAATWGWRAMVKKGELRSFLTALGTFQGMLALLTFSRALWLAMGVEGLVLFGLFFRSRFRQLVRSFVPWLLILVPLGIVMFNYSFSFTARSSNETRTTLTEIAMELFRSNPIVGAGAGTFVERVGTTRVFVMEYGNPLDSHGVIQKLAAETGTLGLAAFAWFVIAWFFLIWKSWKSMEDEQMKQVLGFVAAGAIGAMVFQLFNTDYWTAKMWIPIGMSLAAAMQTSTKSQIPNSKQ